MSAQPRIVYGSVDKNGNAMIAIRIRASGDRAGSVQAVIDTGFNDCLALPRDVIEQLSLRVRTTARYALADGSEAVARLFPAEVEWFGAWRHVVIVELDGGPLLGMAMLRGSHLSIEVKDGGRVVIQPLD